METTTKRPRLAQEGMRSLPSVLPGSQRKTTEIWRRENGLKKEMGSEETRLIK